MKRQFSDDERLINGENQKLILKPIRTYVSSRQLEFTDLFSNNVVSERVRQDPREREENQGSADVKFETIQEQDSDDVSEDYCVSEEHSSEGNKMTTYNSGKDIKGSNDVNIYSKRTSDLATHKPRLSKEYKRYKTVEEVVYEEIDDVDFEKLLNQQNAGEDYSTEVSK